MNPNDMHAAYTSGVLKIPVICCPDPLLRAPRLEAACSELSLAPPGLREAIAAVIFRDTQGVTLTDAQRLNHFPASELMCISWCQGTELGTIERGPDGPQWSPFAEAVWVSGSQFHPTVSWAPGEGRAGMICFTADNARRLFGIDPASVHDRFVPATLAMGPPWAPLFNALLTAPDMASVLQALTAHVLPHWQSLKDPAQKTHPLRELGRQWVEQLAWQAHEWRRTHSPRQVERRVQNYSGRSLRAWKGLVRTEGLFFAARERHEAGHPLDWAALAHDEGFADQSHMVRSARRITGFTPTEFAQRFEHDESFWMYRLWM